MLREVLLINILLCPLVILKGGHKDKQKNISEEDLGGALISSLRNDVNVDLSMDEDYEDLRAELLAYHTALASLAEDTVTPDNVGAVATPQPNTRRSLKTTACWQLGGICIPSKMCKGHKYLTEIPGCKDKLEVCCFTWNRYQARDFRNKDITNFRFPWTNQKEIGGKGISHPKDRKTEDLTPQVLQVFDVVNRNKAEKKIESDEIVKSEESRENIKSDQHFKSDVNIESGENIDSEEDVKSEGNIESKENTDNVESGESADSNENKEYRRTYYKKQSPRNQHR